MQGLLKLALDLGPLLVFFAVYRYTGDVLPATALLIPATMLSLAITYLLEKRIAVMPLVSGIAVAIFGGLTLWLQDELFIKMKPTLVNLLFASILLAGTYFRKPMLKYALGEALAMRDEGWMILTKRWGLYFVFLAVLNEVIWRNFPTDFWVNFKVFGMFTCTMIFTFAQLPLMQKYMIEEKPDAAE